VGFGDLSQVVGDIDNSPYRFGVSVPSADRRGPRGSGSIVAVLIQPIRRAELAGQSALQRRNHTAINRHAGSHRIGAPTVTSNFWSDDEGNVVWFISTLR